MFCLPGSALWPHYKDVVKIAFKFEWTKGNEMADDWLDKEIEQKQEARAERRFGLLLAGRAERGAPRLFKDVADCVRLDVERYQAELGDKSIQFDFRPSRSFSVRRSHYPVAELRVELRDVTIEYQHSFTPNDVTSPQVTTGYFRIEADAAGNVQARQDGSAVVPAQISAVLLKPVFDALG
jgi:hypothetical protein